MKNLFLVINNNIEIIKLISKELLEDSESHQLLALDMIRYIPSISFSKLNIRSELCNLKYFTVDDFPSKNAVDLLLNLNPDIIILPNDTGISCLAFVEASNFLKIPSLFIQPAIIIKSPSSPMQWLRGLLWLGSIKNWKEAYKVYRFLWSTEKRIKGASLAYIYVINNMANHIHNFFNEGSGGCTNIAVMGDYFKDMFLKKGVPEDKIHVTGLPKFDLTINRCFNKSVFLQKLGLDSNKKVVSLLTDAAVEHRLWTRNQRIDFIKKIISTFKNLPEIQLIIKVHPIEDMTDYIYLAKTMGYNAIISKEIDLYDVIDSSDAVISGISTAGLESLLFNKPLIISNFYKDPEYIPYISSGVAIGVYHGGDLISAIDMAINDDRVKNRMKFKSKDFIYNYAYLNDGLASKRVAELILKSANKPNV